MFEKYTAKDYRDAAKTANDWGFLTTAEMLRQAADVMECEEKRQKKYEYGALWNGLAISNITESIESAKKAVEVINSEMPSPIEKLVRRTVSEWEEVKDGE